MFNIGFGICKVHWIVYEDYLLCSGWKPDGPATGIGIIEGLATGRVLSTERGAEKYYDC